MGIKVIILKLRNFYVMVFFFFKFHPILCLKLAFVSLLVFPWLPLREKW